jgi:hypothetical protein
MIIKKIEQSPVTAEDIKLYKEKTSKLKGYMFTANDVNMNKRIVSLRLTEEDELILVNPTLVQHSEQPVVYYEKDTNKPTKVRKTIRSPYLVIETDNLGKVEFKPTKENWETEKWTSFDEFLSDAGLLECVLVQRLMDAIAGIDLTSPERAYSETVIKTQKEPGRNERVMLQGPNGEMQFVKYKNAGSLISQGYKLM